MDMSSKAWGRQERINVREVWQRMLVVRISLIFWLLWFSSEALGQKRLRPVNCERLGPVCYRLSYQHLMVADSRSPKRLFGAALVSPNLPPAAIIIPVSWPGESPRSSKSASVQSHFSLSPYLSENMWTLTVPAPALMSQTKASSIMNPTIGNCVPLVSAYGANGTADCCSIFMGRGRESTLSTAVRATVKPSCP